MLVLGYYFFAVILAMLAYCAFKLNGLYLLFVLVSAAVLAYTFCLLAMDRYHESQHYSKWSMLASLLAYIAAILK